MTLKERIQAKAVIRTLAQRDGVRPEDVRASMQEAIDAAWENQDPAVRWKQLQMFPAGKPTVEAFVLRLAKEICPPTSPLF